MRQLYILLLLFILPASLFSQDLLVVSSGDSINCTIRKITSRDIHYTYRKDFDIIETIIAMEDIISYQEDFYPRSDIPSTYKSGLEFNCIHIYANGGFGFLTASLADGIPEDMRDFYHGMKSGLTGGLSVFYLLGNEYGIGLKYKTFRSYGSAENVEGVTPLGTSFTGDISAKNRTNFFGPALAMYYSYGDFPGSFYTNFFLGYTEMKNEYEMSGSNYLVSGKTAGLGLEGGYELEVFNNFMITLEASFFIGGIRKLTIESGSITHTIELEGDEFESLYRFDIGIGISFIL